MLDFIKKIVPSSIMRAMVVKTARQVAAWIAAALVTWMAAHHASPDDASTIATGVTALIVGLASWGFSLWDVPTVADKMTTAAVTGSLAAADDPQTRADVAQAVKTQQAISTAAAGAPTTKDAAIARLRAGTA